MEIHSDPVNLKANPFLMLTSNYDSIEAMETFLTNLFPTMDVETKRIGWDEYQIKKSKGEIVEEQIVRTASGVFGYAVWFLVNPKTPIAMSVEDVKNAFESVKYDLLESAQDDNAIEHDLVDMYNDDARDYAKIVELLEAGDIKAALEKHCSLDTASRGRIWGAPVVLEDEVGFAVFLEENKYPNRLSEYCFF